MSVSPRWWPLKPEKINTCGTLQNPRDIAKPAGMKNDVDSMRSLEFNDIREDSGVVIGPVASNASTSVRVGDAWKRVYEGRLGKVLCSGTLRSLYPFFASRLL